ncbi:hypothetical protein Tco_0904118, partial [Tanacetum coccineum]
FQDQERYEHVGPQDTRPQDGERSQDDDQRLDLADDLKKAQDHISKIVQWYDDLCSDDQRTIYKVPTKRPPPVTNCVLGLAAVTTWQRILNKEFGIISSKEDVGGSSNVRSKGKRKML